MILKHDPHYYYLLIMTPRFNYPSTHDTPDPTLGVRWGIEEPDIDRLSDE